MATWVLGLSAFYHDSAAALLCDGHVVAAAQEERFSRVKGDPGFPAEAVAYCLREAGIEANDLDVAAFYEKPLVKLDRQLETMLGFAPRGFAAFRRTVAAWTGTKLRILEAIRHALGPACRARVVFATHHESHAASAFFPSPFEEAAILTLDAVGEWSTSSIGLGRGHRVTLLHETRFPHSLGMLYSAFTSYTGFKVNSGEYKLMGLAPYGEPRYVDLIFERLARVDDDGSLWLDMSYFDYGGGLTMTSAKFHDLFGGPPRSPEAWITTREMDLAASVQAVCEEVVLRAARHAHRLTGARHLVMAGGVALNCVANSRLLRDGPFESLWVQPAAGDAGGALGAAYLAWHHGLDRPRPVPAGDAQQGSLLGPAFDDAEIGVFLDAVGARHVRLGDEACLLDTVARLLAGEKIVGWFHGRMEYGPRALGARSILGDPRSPRMQQTMNLKIKFRESFRPFAPAVLRECADQVFEMRPKTDSPYMLFVMPVREDVRTPLGPAERAAQASDDLRVRVSVPRSTVPAVTHVDYSARVQTVDPDRHGRFYRLLRRFYELTNCPVIVNTSFNVRGEPIVCTPEDAYHCFMATGMDALVLEDHLLLKTDQPEASREEAEAYRARFEPD